MALGSVLVLTLLSSLTLELFFVFSLIGFLVVTELMAPFNLTMLRLARTSERVPSPGSDSVR